MNNQHSLEIPEDVKSLYGQPVIGAWLYPGDNKIMLRFADRFLEVSAQRKANGIALVLEVGKPKQGADFSDLDSLMNRNVYTRALIGLRFIGIDCNVLEFSGLKSGLVGAKIEPDAIQWVRENVSMQ